MNRYYRAGPSTQKKSPPTIGTTPSRPTAGHRRTSSIGLTRAPSLRSPALSASTSRSVSPQKPGSSNGKTSPSANATSRFRAPNPPSPTKRPTLSSSVSVQRPRAAVPSDAVPTSPVTTNHTPIDNSGTHHLPALRVPFCFYTCNVSTRPA